MEEGIFWFTVPDLAQPRSESDELIHDSVELTFSLLKSPELFAYRVVPPIMGRFSHIS